VIALLGGHRNSSAIHQRGQAIFLAALFLFLGVSAALYATFGSTSVAIANRQATIDAQTLAQVKDALIGWSAARTPTAASPNIRPGELPCPDIDNSGTDAGACAAGAIGRVPWKSLGIPDPKDSTGETLWYAIAGPFRNYNMSNSPITSDTLGTLTVYQGSNATTLTSQAVAVIFAPGAALGTQNRSSTDTAACATTGTTIERNRCASNYLEATNGGNNAQTGGPFIQAQTSSAFNDRVLAITNDDLMPLVEQRVAREIISLLNAYKAATATSLLGDLLPGIGVYPWADLADGNSNGAPFAAYNRNRFPCGNALPTDWGTIPTLGTTATPTLPNWLTNGCWSTGWSSLIYYAVARNRLELNGLICSTCSAGLLSVTNPSSRPGTVCTTASPPVCTSQVITAGNADLVLITPGAATASRASGWPVTFSAITLYFEDLENRDNDNTDDTYTVPASTNHDRDRIYIVR
jgi:hypothetical protein